LRCQVYDDQFNGFTNRIVPDIGMYNQYNVQSKAVLEPGLSICNFEVDSNLVADYLVFLPVYRWPFCFEMAYKPCKVRQPPVDFRCGVAASQII